MKRALKHCPHHFLDDFGLAECIIVKHRHSGLFQFAALHDQPFRAYFLDFRVVFTLEDRTGQVGGQVYMEDFGQHGELFLVRNRLEARDDRDMDAHITAGFDEIEILLVIEEHLGGNILRSRFDLGLEVHEVGFEVRRFEVLFGVAGYADAEIRFSSIFDVLFEIDALVEADDLFQQIDGIAMAIGLWLEGTFIPGSVAAEDEYVIDSEEMQVDEGVFGLPFGKPAADEMGDCIYLIMVHDCRADAYRARALADFDFLEGAVGFLLEHRLAAVVGDVDKRGLEFHQRVQMIINRADRLPFEWRKDFKRDMGVFGLL